MSEVEAQDFDEPLLGFRVWALEPSGTLRAMVASGDWTAGENQARCLSGRHRAPHPNCGCGFNALHAPPKGFISDPRLAVGAIAAWGEVDVFNTGFRAEFAKVVALAKPHRAQDQQLDRLRLASQKYGVPLVKFASLADYAAEFAARVPAQQLPTPPAPRRRKPAPLRPQPVRDSLCTATKGVGVWISGHLAFAHVGRKVRIAPTPAVMAATGGALLPAFLDRDPVVAGEPLLLARIGEGTVSCPSPVSGQITKLREPAEADLDRGPGEDDGWVVEISTRAEPIDDWPVAWGLQAADRYRHLVLAAGSDAALLGEIGGGGRNLVPAWEAQQWLSSLASSMDDALVSDPSSGDAVDRLGVPVVFAVSGVGALTIGPSDHGEPRVRSGSDNVDADAVHLGLAPRALMDYWSGSLVNGAGALSDFADADAPIQIRAGSSGRARLAMSIHQRLFPAAREIFEGLGDPWFRAGDAVGDGARNRKILAGPIGKW